MIMVVWLPAIASVVAVSLVSLLGVVTMAWDQRRVRRLSLIFISFAAGALLGDAFIHLVPECFAAADDPLRPSLLVLAGIVLFFVVEKLLRHAHGPLHEMHHGHAHDLPALRVINVVGDALHNFIDGVLIGASYLVTPELGVTTTVAVVLHEIPQEIGDFAVLIHSGMRARKAVLLNLASASTAILGTVLVLIVGSAGGEAIAGALVPVTAGAFVYIAAADLLPELQHDRSLHGLAVQTALITAGVAIMGALTMVD
jgi:zinc and cadmium transporter